MIRKQLMEVKNTPRNINEWYKRVINLDRYQRKNKREKERLRKRKEKGT